MAYKSEILCTAALAGVASMMSAAPAFAQAIPEESGIEDIIVTARKTAESAQSVPVTMTALSQAGLERQVVLNVQDLQTSVPGLFVAPNSQGGAPTFAIRAAKAE